MFGVVSVLLLHRTCALIGGLNEVFFGQMADEVGIVD